MLLNYIKITLRNIKKKKTYSIISLLGLAIGMACFILISLFVFHESNYDRYHADVDRVFRVVVHTNFNSMITLAQTSDLTVPEIRSKFPQVEAAARIYNRKGSTIKSGREIFFDDRVFYTEPDLFKILTIPVLVGDAAALSSPNNVLLSESLALKLFGTSDTQEKIVEINDTSYTVAGVVADPPSNGHLQYSCFVSHESLKKGSRMSWTRFDTGSYIKLKNQVDASTFEQRLMPLTEEYLPALEGEKRIQTYLLQPVTDIHLTRDLMFDDDVIHGSRTFLFVLSCLSFIILIIACVNFVILATACSATRFREVGMRKVVGAQKRQLIHQFLGESSLLAVLAFVFALMIVSTALPGFSELTGIPFSFQNIIQDKLIVLWIGLIVFVGLIAGAYPAFFISSFDPIDILKKQPPKKIQGGSRMRRLLFVGQFSVSILLVIATITMKQQIRFMKNHPLGFEKEQKLVIPLPRNQSEPFDYSFIKHELSNFASIQSATLSSGVPGRRLDYSGTQRSDQQWENSKRVYHFFVDEDFIFNFNLEWASTSLPKKALISGLKNGAIVNEMLVRDFGWNTIDEALGQRIVSGSIGEEREILGVVKDFHFKGLNEPIEPLIIAGRIRGFSLITLSVDIRSLAEIIPFLKTKWETLFPAHPFDYFFLDENFDRAYRQDEQVFHIVTIFSILGISIACFGLFGMATFLTERRTKEIGIRKVLGSSTSSIINLLCREHAVWVIVANLLAWPAAYFIMNKWLQNFSFRITLDLGIFLSAGLIALGLVWLTVSIQALKTARANPVNSLRYE